MNFNSKQIPLAPSPTRCQLVVSVAIVFFLSISICFVFSLSQGLPYPLIHDEYSYCLAGETFASGRLTNATHPMAEHFETMHVLQYPTNMSKYPPGQGIVLAIGHWIGHPIFGVWLSLALACAAMCWAMAAVFDVVWASVCCILFAFSMNCTFYLVQIGYWAQSYWGGSVACLGSALALGSVLWMSRDVNSASASLGRDSASGSRIAPAGCASAVLTTVFVIGSWILAISRPLEGLMVAVPMVIAMLRLWIKVAMSASCLATLNRLALPILVGLLGFIWLGYYNAKVTGSPLLLPYTCYQQQYALAPLFLRQPRNESPGFQNEPMRAFHEEWEVGVYQSQQTWQGYLEKKQSDLTLLWGFFLGISLSIPVVVGCLVSAVLMFRQPRSGIAPVVWIGGAAIGLFLLVHSQTVWMNPHYLAPLVPILWCFIGLGLVYLSSWKVFQFEFGLLLAIGCVGFAAIERYEEFDTSSSRMASVDLWHHQRQRIETQLQSTPGQHLVLIEYAPFHSPHDEWCYNSADIDRSKIVWARDLGSDKNDALLRYFSHRSVHRLAVDAGHVTHQTLTDK